MLANYLLLLRRAWAHIGKDMMPPVLIAGGLSIVALLPLWPGVIVLILVAGALFCLGWVLWQLWQYVLEHPDLAPQEVLPLESMPGYEDWDEVTEAALVETEDTEPGASPQVRWE